MLLSFGLLFLVGLFAASICQKLGLPRIIGMLASGIALGPYVLDLFDSSILGISADLRQMALIIILIKAGLTLNISDLKQVGRPAVLMSFLPACFEIAAYFLFAPFIFDITHTEALVMGSVLAAVSPAIVVPRMVNLIEAKYGTKKGVPQMILAGASCDDVFVIVIFTTFTAMASGENLAVSSLTHAPIAILLGVFVGGVAGILLNAFFESCHKREKAVRNSVKVIIILAISFVLISTEHQVNIPFSGLISIVIMACMYKFKGSQQVIESLSKKFGRLWIAAEIVLFVLVGAVVDIGYMLQAGAPAILMIALGLAIRTIGVFLSLLGTKLNFKERIFCIFAYLPKATVQAAIGAVPLAMGLSCGDIVLSVAIWSIIITAPLGAIAIDYSYKKLLSNDA